MCDAEVRDLDVPLVVDHHVLRLDVAVHDALRVREALCRENLQADVDRKFGVERAHRDDDVLQRAAGQVLHRDVVGLAHLAAVKDVDDVLVLQACGGLGLALKARHEGLIGGEALVHHLQGHRATKVLVIAEVDVGHPARADAATHRVAVVDQSSVCEHTHIQVLIGGERQLPATCVSNH